LTALAIKHSQSSKTRRKGGANSFLKNKTVVRRRRNPIATKSPDRKNSSVIKEELAPVDQLSIFQLLKRTEVKILANSSSLGPRL